MTQQDKALKGDERKGFMSERLKGDKKSSQGARRPPGTRIGPTRLPCVADRRPPRRAERRQCAKGREYPPRGLPVPQLPV